MSQLNNQKFTLRARRGTAANLALSTTYLLEGELAFTTDNKRLSIGDDSGNKKTIGTYILFDHYADVGNIGTGEDDLYSDTLPASTLANNGEKVTAQYSLILVSSGTATRQIKAYFGGTLILDSAAQTFASGGNIEIWITVIRESSTVVRVTAELVPSGITLQPIVTYTRITGLTLTNTQILKITGEAAGVGAATDDIVAKLGYVEWKPAA